jgi:ADP-ribosylglycohydrolase
MVIQQTAGCLFGMAFGDSLGADTEFWNVKQIIEKFPPRGPQNLRGNPSLVTDDTQMALAVGRALRKAERPYTRATLFVPLRDEFLTWFKSPDNNRAPGNTCLAACKNLENGLPWYDATIISSKGCGANMRVAPVGVLPPDKDGLTESTRSAIAQFQAALTHGHPTALAAADITAAAIANLMCGGDVQGLPGRLRAYALSQRTVWHADWLDPLLPRMPAMFGESPEAFIAYGWDECLGILDRLDAALVVPDRNSDPCKATGLGWVAEEAFGTGLLCFLLFPDDPVAAIQRAVVTAGDSDSIACLTGAFAGAFHGLAAWPADWVQRIEYRTELAELSATWE